MQNNNPYKKVLTKIVILFVLVYVIDFIVGAGLKQLYFNYNHQQGKFYRQTYALDSAKADILIVGSSRAFYHYMPEHFEDSFHTTCYNAGYEGSLFLHQYATLKAMLKRYTPKMIIWDYWNGFEKAQKTYDELSSLLPYYDQHPEMRSTINLKSDFEKYKMVSKIYPYNSTIVYTLSTALGFYENSEKGRVVNGVNIQNVYKGKLKYHHRSKPLSLDTNCVNAYKDIIAYCKQKNIKLYIVISPRYEVFNSGATYDSLAKSIADSSGVPFFDFSKDYLQPIDRQYFRQPIHLNIEGANLFTNRLIKRIKE